MRFFLLYLLVNISACSKTSDTGGSVITPPPYTAKTWLALGDSYTIGQSVSATDRYPSQTAALLRLSGINISEPDYIATSGWTSGNLQNAINTYNPSAHTVVSLLIGVNDQYQLHDTTGYRLRFTQLLEKSIQLANGKKENVFVLSIPDYSVTPFASSYDTARIRREIALFNSINYSVASSYQCPYLDITASTRDAVANSIYLASDGLHLSAEEYKRWAQRLAPMMSAVLR